MGRSGNFEEVHVSVEDWWKHSRLGVEPEMMRLGLLFRFLIVLGAAILTTFFSGLLLFVTVVSLGGSIDSFYGFPLSWKENIEFVCSPLHPQACQSPIYVTQYDWGVFALDVLFYIAVGYGVLFIYAKYHARKPSGAANHNP